ncbi:hypothetical protein, partial [Lichenibacterium minor]|uniref:hypothetical protein n=1 Tax=Lichenibacterium minor TaxID=2316528 RepID=UPI0013ED50F8
GDNALNALRNPAETRRGLNAYDAKLSAFGIDPNKAAEDARKVQRAYDNLSTDLALIHQKIDTQFFVPMMDAFDGMAKWVEEHPDVVEPLEKGLVAFAGVMSLRVLPVVGNLLKVLTGLGSVTLSPAILAAIGVGGAKYLADNTMSNVDPWRDQSTGETALRAIDPGLADRTYGKRGEQLPHGPHHGLGTHATPHDDRNLWQRTMPKALGGKDAPEGAAPTPSPIERLRRAARGPGKGVQGPAGVPYAAKSATEAMGISQGEWDAFREGVTDIEGKRYDRMGGAGNRYAGRYQMGPAEITETAGRLSVARPSNAQFLADPAMQERFFENYTVDHYQTLMGNGRFAAMTPRERLKILGYAHNQGTGSPRRGGGAWSYLNSGAVGHDAFGTAGTAYLGTIGKRLNALGNRSAPPVSPAAPPPYHPDDDRASRARASDVPYGASGHLSPIQYTHARPANPLADLYKDGFLKVEVAKPIPGISDLKRTQEHIARLHKDGLLMPKLDHRALITSSLTHSVRHGNVHHERHGDTFHVHGTDAKTGLNEAAKVSARRESQDRIRYGQG